MKTLRIPPSALRILYAAALLCAASTQAATWNLAFGMGNASDDVNISGSGAPFAVVTSVHSNAVYYITSARSSGGPLINNVYIQPDATAGTLKWYVATNSWTIGSNATAGATTIWLNATNTGMATNDLVVYQDVANDSYQLAIISGNATSSSGLVSTNAAGYNNIKIFQTITNALTAGDKLWKLSAVQSITPFTLQNVTNDTVAPWGNWWNLASRGNPMTFGAPAGVPGCLVLTYSNAAAMNVSGAYSNYRIRIR